jgi:hypothetical protein
VIKERFVAVVAEELVISPQIINTKIHIVVIPRKRISEVYG